MITVPLASSVQAVTCEFRKRPEKKCCSMQWPERVDVHTGVAACEIFSSGQREASYCQKWSHRLNFKKLFCKVIVHTLQT